ncbi:NADPH-dependent 1-acyldihydroxyacetone phosphate reductase [Hypsizygus marmoreus]|uniref:NADPH-dependent 1-acyldihydroxyacetone phosphate reductase n=1 Tax=Hypsizygus marmoreus TaxID=39966 RepID=A0A369K299_HYPMA|nr:NADPH-dependent 1-acyldihydroxyacetone phosphate reductase [Hypsizygus marmoreus]
MTLVVLVTGCSTGGIGFALCNEFARQGCKVYATARDVEKMGEFEYGGIKKLPLDVTSDEAVERTVHHIVEVEGQIDVVVNNAGSFCSGPLIDQSLDDVKRNFDTNTYSVLRTAKAAIPYMAKRRSGVIVNIGSVVGEIATPWNGLYCASKAAVQSISDVLYMECKPFNVKVLHVAPGAVVSNISANGGARFSLPENSLYTAFLPNILQRIYASQASNAMPADVFAQKVVSKALSRRPPLYMSLGGTSRIFAFFKWLPKTWVLFLMWRVYSKKIKT